MKLVYEGTDITGFVNITRCMHRDVSHGRADCMELEMDHAETWYRWKPQLDDRLRMIHRGYDTGELYLNAIVPRGNKYAILATSLPASARRTTWQTYTNETLDSLMRRCAAECGMESGLYGVDGKLYYSFLMRRNEGCAAFLNRVGEWEGAAVKAVNGAFRAIAVGYAQKRPASEKLRITTSQDGVTYTRRENLLYSGLTVLTPHARASAFDETAGKHHHPVITGLPARDAAQAGRWARALLMMNNRKAEELTVKSALDARLSAMVRVDVSGNTDASGEWLVEEAVHDFVNKTTEVRMLRASTLA